MGCSASFRPRCFRAWKNWAPFFGAEPQGRRIPDVTAKGGLSYEAALKTADEIVNHLFGTSMKDYELESVEIAHWENRDTCRYEFSPVVGGLPLGSAPFDLDVRSQEDWGVSFVLYTVDGVETPHWAAGSLRQSAGDAESRFGEGRRADGAGAFPGGNPDLH